MKSYQIIFFGNFFLVIIKNLFTFRPVNGSLVKQKIDILVRLIFLESDSDIPKITILVM